MAIDEIDHNLQIIACAGSGKTFVITRRIANILKQKKYVNPENIVAFTFTEKAAESMRGKINDVLAEQGMSFAGDRMFVGTIHSFCKNLLENYTDKYKNLDILDTVKSFHFIDRYASTCGMSELGLYNSPDNIHLFMDCIDKMLYDYNHRSMWPENVKTAMDKYMACLDEKSFVDFSLLIFYALQEIRGNPDVKEYLSTIKFLIVDEYQDVDDMQEQLISCIAEFGANICVVGDDDQTIYQFRGSNADNMIGFSRRYSDVTQIRLEKNFRCSGAIVDVARISVENNKKRLTKRMQADSGDGQKVQTMRSDTETGLYDSIAQEICSLHRMGLKYSDVAILVRKTKYIGDICKQLAELGIPYAADNTERFFAGDNFSRYMQILLAVNDPDNEKQNFYTVWGDVAERKKLVSVFRYLRDNFSSGGAGKRFYMSEIIFSACEQLGYFNSEYPGFNENIADFNAVKKILDDYDHVYLDYQLSARVRSILEFTNLENKKGAVKEYRNHKFDSDEAVDAVQIMTIHKSKGLEFDTVFIPHLEKGEFPSKNGGGKRYWHVLGRHFEMLKEQYDSDMEDERKLYYVALTRAENRLYLCYCLGRKSLSPFVKESAESHMLDISAEDINFISEAEREAEERRIANLAKKARAALREYYGSAIPFNKAAIGDLSAVKFMSDSEAISEAEYMGLL